MSMISSTPQTARSLARHGVAFAPQIASAAAKYGVDARLLAAVAAQETGGPGSNAGRNVVGDAGHGHGVFQIDDRFHSFAKTAQAMQPQANADYAAGMIASLLHRYGGDVHKALSAYNAGDPRATGTVTTWKDGRKLGYADSVLRHYADLGGSPEPQDLGQMLAAESATEQGSVSALSSFASLAPPPFAPAQHRSMCPSAPDFGAIVDASGDSSG